MNVLRRIIPQKECPGTCCKKQGLVPDETGRCKFFTDIKGRRFGGCTFINVDNSVDQTKLNNADMPQELKDKFNRYCNQYPVPALVPAFDTEYETTFGRGFAETEVGKNVCECFAWEKT